ncbi:MAG: TolC family outer membrane protein [Chromatiales bacterium]|jgi:outer membrane protein
MKSLTKLLPFLLFLMLPGAQARDLLAVYELALQNDPQLKAAEEQLNSARLTENIAKAQLRPTIGLGATYDYSDRDIIETRLNLADGTFSDTFLGLNLTMPLYRRQLYVQLEQADSVIAQAEAQYAAAQIDLMARSTSAYFLVLAAEDDLRVAKSETEATGRQLEQAQQRFDVGLIAITDVHEAKAAYDGARASEIASENNLDNAWEALFEIIGPSPKTELAKLGDGLELLPPKPNDLQQWSDTAQQQNFELIANQSNLETIRQEIEIQRSGHYPSLNLVGGYDMNRSTNDSTTEANTARIGLELSVPLYTGGLVTAQTEQAWANFRAAQQQLDQTRRAVNRQVRDAFRGVLSNISRVDALKAATVSARSALESTQAGYEVGTRTIVDVLNVQRNLFSSQRDYLGSRYDYIINGLALKSAAGNLTEEDLKRVNGWLEQQ